MASALHRLPAITRGEVFPSSWREAQIALMDLVLGGLPAMLERPATPKFAQPLVLLPELFTTISHLSLLTGYLVSLGWEVCAIDLYASTPGLRPDAGGLSENAAEAITALNRQVITIGHGLGGLIALSLTTHPAAAASVAIAPALPGFRSPLWRGWRNRLATRFGGRLGRMLRPPAGRTLFEFVADADPFQRDTLIRTLRPAPAAPARVPLAVPPAGLKPRLIVTGDADIFAPFARVREFAASAGAELVTLDGRGHWLIGGRALERVVQAIQRFLVKTLGQELLLLYPEK